MELLLAGVSLAALGLAAAFAALKVLNAISTNSTLTAIAASILLFILINI